MQWQDVANITLSSVSLVVAIVALVVSKRVAAISVSTPLVIQKLYELVEYFQGRQLGKDLGEDIKRMSEDLTILRQRGFILRQAGFGDRLEDLERKATAFRDLSKELLPRADSVTEAEAKEVSERANRFAEALQALLNDLEPKLERVFKDPFNSKY